MTAPEPVIAGDIRRLAAEYALSRPAVEWAREIHATHVQDIDPNATVLALPEAGQVIRLDNWRCCRQCSRIGFNPENTLIAWPCDAWRLATAVLHEMGEMSSAADKVPS